MTMEEDFECMIIVGKDKPVSDNESLQANFKKFQEQRRSKRKELEDLRKRADAERGTPGFKDGLRKKFIETATKYLGVPYAKRYHEPENCRCEGCVEKGINQFHEPLFLDCCALVRRCVYDLREHFGFTLNGGNQVSQFDSLPPGSRVESVSELEPGDLIFYEGEYYSANAKPQGHNLVHVEIYTGGEAVIGSRERFKWVKEYDSYRIENSQRWKLLAYHFVKIDAWLDGVYENHCAEHPWKTCKPCENAKIDPNRKSVFADDSGEESDGDCD